MRRGDIYWADLGPPAGRRPVVVVTRSPAIPILNAVTVAPITRTVRGHSSEVGLGSDQGLSEECVANCDGLVTLPRSRIDDALVGSLGPGLVRDLDRALRFALEIVY